MNRLRSIVHLISYALDWVARWALVGLMAVVIVNICLRWLKVPATGFFELICFLGAIAFVFAWAHTQVHKGHIYVRVLVERLSQRTQLVIGSIMYFLSLGICIIISWHTIALGYELWHRGQVLSVAVPVPISPLAFIIAFGTIMLCLVLLIDLADLLSRAEKR